MIQGSSENQAKRDEVEEGSEKNEEKKEEKKVEKKDDEQEQSEKTPKRKGRRQSMDEEEADMKMLQQPLGVSSLYPMFEMHAITVTPNKRPPNLGCG